jgi:hypothetical protein
MKNFNLRNLDQDLNRGIEYNRKHGGVSDKLKSIMKRPERGDGNWRMNAMSNIDPLPVDKCKCGNNKFQYQEHCSECYWKKQKNVQSK